MACGCKAACTGCGCGCHRFTPPAAAGAAAARLSAMWDRARDSLSRAGLRPYGVSIVRARAAGMRARGDGPTEIVGQWPILPTPKIGDLTAISQVLDADQLREQGQVLLSEISLSYSEDMLLGRGEDGSPIPPGDAVFYEIRYFDAQGRSTTRMRFVAASRPSANTERGEWTILLVRAPWDRERTTGILR